MKAKTMGYTLGVAFLLSLNVARAQAPFALGPVETDSSKFDVVILGQRFALAKETVCTSRGRVVSRSSCVASLSRGAYAAAEASVLTPATAARVTILPLSYVPGASPVMVGNFVSAVRPDIGIVRLGALDVDSTSLLAAGPFELVVGQFVEISGLQPLARGAVLADGLRYETATITGTGRQLQTITGTGIQTITGTGTQTITGTGIQTITGTGTQSVVGSGTQTITGTGKQTITGTGKQTITGTGAQIQTITGTGRSVQTQTITGTGRQLQTQTITGTGRQVQTQTITGTGRAATTQTITGTGRLVQTQTITGTGRAATSQTITGTGRQLQTQTITGTGRQLQTDTITGTGRALQRQTITGTGIQ